MRHIIFMGIMGDIVIPILRGLAANTSVVDRTVQCLHSIGTLKSLLGPQSEWVQITIWGKEAISTIVNSLPKTVLTKFNMPVDASCLAEPYSSA